MIVSEGTLVVMVAANGGAVLASDTRLTVENAFCDGVEKFVEPLRPDHAMLFVTGRRGFYPIDIQQTTDVCAYVRRVPREFDLAEVARRHFEDANTNVADLDLASVGRHCAEETRQYILGSKYAIWGMPGEAISSLVFVDYNPVSLQVAVRSVQLVFGASFAQFDYRLGLNEQFGPDDIAEPILFGEQLYFTQHVMPRFLEGPIKEETRKYWLKFPAVRQMPFDTAIDIATDIIQAASRTTETIAANSGIGGPLD